MNESITEQEKEFLERLSYILEKEEFSKDNYSFVNDNKERKVYLTKEGRKWQIYIIKNGEKAALSEFDSLEEAVRDFVASLTEDNEKLKTVCDYMFEEELEMIRSLKKR